MSRSSRIGMVTNDYMHRRTNTLIILIQGPLFSAEILSVPLNFLVEFCLNIKVNAVEISEVLLLNFLRYDYIQFPVIFKM